MIDVDAVVLASGMSKRMGVENKLLLEYDGKTLIEKVIGAILKANCFKNILVIIKDREVEEIVAKYNVKTIFNPNFKTGKSEAIKLSLKILGESDGTMFFVGDQPFVDGESILKLWGDFIENKDNIIAPYINKSIGNPIIFPKSLYGQLKELSDEEGGMKVLKNNTEHLSKVRINNYKMFFDVDTKEDYDILLNKMI